MNARFQSAIPNGYSMFNGEGFGTLQTSGQRVVAKFWNGDKATTIPVPQADKLFAKGEGFASLPAKVGHIYLLRQFASGKEDVIFKVMVLAMTPDSLTLRYSVMRNDNMSANPQATPRPLEK